MSRSTIYLPGELKAELEAYASKLDRSVSYVLVKAWEEYKLNHVIILNGVPNVNK
jgi:predicted transcriptional regulator